jgi:hypothetical protein
MRRIKSALVRKGKFRAVRARVYALVGAGTAGFVAIQLGLPRPFGLSAVPVLSRPTQAVVLVMGPALVLGAGVLLIRFSERLTRTDETSAAPT